MQGRVGCSTTDKLHPARQASFWSMKWLGTGMVNPWSLSFSRCSPFSLASLIVWSDLNPRFWLLGWDIPSLHQLSPKPSECQCRLKRVPWRRIERRLTHPRLKGRTRTIIGHLIYKFPEPIAKLKANETSPVQLLQCSRSEEKWPASLTCTALHVHMRVMHACRVEQ